jgi:hypothetical protein
MSAEFAALQRDLPRTSPRAWRYATARAASRTGALVSHGLRVGYTQGFDSGAFMDHVYANRPRGVTAVGRAVDRRLLEQPTCVAFRDIRVLAQRAVLAAIDADPGGAPLVADLAAGPAPYLLEAIAQRPSARALVCDVDADALSRARSAASELGVAERVRCTAADAFDRAALAALDPRPDIVLELGLYGMYHDDSLIERHFRDLAELVAPRQIVFNVQMSNPDIEHIARVWRNRHGERCVWRLRPVAQILDYARAAGYEPQTVEADRFGIYRVVRLARAGAPA